MKIAPLKSVECALLHDEFFPIDGDELLALIAAAAQKFGFKQDLSRLPAGANDVQIMCGDFHIFVSQHSKAMTGDRLSNCTSLPITKLMMPDASSRVSRHTAHSIITVGRGPVPGFNPNRFVNEIMSDRYSLTTSQDAEKAMKLCYFLARSFMKNSKVSAVHWYPSDHLVSPEFFVDAEQGGSLLSLFIRPDLFSSAGQIRAGATIGMIGNGAQYFIGRPIIFNEAKVDLDWMLSRMNGFVALCQTRGSVPADGEKWELDGQEVVAVRYIAPSADKPMGSYELTAIRVPAFGIDGAVQPAQTVYYDPRKDPVTGQSRELDGNDPVDRAIMARLEERVKLGLDKAEGSAEQSRRSGDISVPVPSFGKRMASFGRRQ